MSTTFQPIDELCINTIRTLSIDAVQKANSGHPGMPLGAAPMAYVLWTRHLRHNPTNPKWPDRDRFVLSAGHASMLLYSLLFLTGYDLTMDDITAISPMGQPYSGASRVWRGARCGSYDGSVGSRCWKRGGIGNRGALAGRHLQSAGP